MKVFNVRGNGTEFQMLDPEKFLSKTNGYRVTGSLPVVDSAFMLSRPLVQFNSPAVQLAKAVMRYREQFARLPAALQVDCIFVPIDAGPKRRQDQPARAGAKRKQLATVPSSSVAVVHDLPAPVPPSDRQSHDAAEQSSEATDYDDGALRHLAHPRHRPRGGAGAFGEDECEGQEGEGGGEEGDEGDEGDADAEDNDVDDERDVGGARLGDTRFSQCERPRDGNDSRACRGVDACSGADVDGAGDQPGNSRSVSQSHNQATDGRDKTASRRKRKRGEASTSPASQTKQARANAVNEARRATHELRDSGDEGEGVGPRMPEDVDDLVQRAAPLDTTRCFFLEYDEQGFARQDVHVVNVDVTRIKRIPSGPILYNHRSLSENIVRGIENAIESSITSEPGAWDRLEVVLAPVDPNDVVNGQGRRITPDEFFQRDSAEFDWYAVCGQHTAEAMKRLVEKHSAAVKVYGLRAYSKVRVVFFDDDQTRGYFSVSAFDNTREHRAMMLSFQDAVRDMRQWWIDNDGIKAPKAKVSEKDAAAVAHQKMTKLPQGLHEEGVRQGVCSIVSLKDLCPTYFKNFGDMTCREREVALLLLMKGKVVTTNVKVTPPRVNTECLLDIMRKERYMIRMFNYVVFRTEERGAEEWNGDFFMSYKDLEERYAQSGLCAAEWEKEREKLHSNKVKTFPRRLGGVDEGRQGAGLGPTEVMYKEAPFHFKVFIYTMIDKLDLLRAEVKRIASSARHLVWHKFGRQTILLPVCMRTKEVLAAPDDVVASAKKMTCRDAIVDISATNFSSAWTSEDFDALYKMMEKCCGPNWVLFFFAPQKVQSNVLRHLSSSDVTRYDNIATTRRDLMVIVLRAEGGDLKKVTVAPRLHNDLTEVHVVEDKFGKCQGKHGGVEGDESVVYSVWERESGKLRKLCSSFVGEAEGVLLLGRAHAGLVWEFLLAGNNVIACDESAKDVAYLTKFIDILVKEERFECRLEKLRATYRTNRDMYHKLGPKRQKTFVARCEILKFDLHKDRLTFKDYADLAKSGEGFNPVDREEDSADSDLDIGNDTNATGWRGQSAAMEHDGKEYGPGRSEGCSTPPPANSVASMVDRVACTPMEEGEDDEIDIPAQATKLASGDPIPHAFCADPDTVRFLEDKHTRTGEDKWGHDIIWHVDIFQPCIQDGEWKMAVKYEKGWRPFPRMGKDSWLKTTEQVILYGVRKENPGESENSIATKAKQLFNALRASWQLEYRHNFYELQTSPSRGSIDWKVDRIAAAESTEVDSREDVSLVSEAAAGITKGEQREDVGTTSALKPPLPEVGNTSAGKEPIIVISIETGDISQGGHVSLDKPSDAGATYGSLLATGATMAGRSEIELESTAGMDVTGMLLHPPSCTSKGDAHCTTTSQGGAAGDDGDGGNAEGSQCSRNLEHMTTDDEDGAEGGKGVIDPTHVENEG
ncbi:hypothetical protein CBR_g2707 [Chara braunii]|uniref:Uncharacterized protein n=1 Tax=Chara braunii TaxID=69332 RepID=A0A388KDS2_CHABU|nr:hypothetical protein CBR_g2707 [Chara braunii]|eukprot:GBG68156.1 hypothetical protein CBR_g2707 [Chara braunii]